MDAVGLWLASPSYLVQQLASSPLPWYDLPHPERSGILQHPAGVLQHPACVLHNPPAEPVHTHHSEHRGQPCADSNAEQALASLLGAGDPTAPPPVLSTWIGRRWPDHDVPSLATSVTSIDSVNIVSITPSTPSPPTRHPPASDLASPHADDAARLHVPRTDQLAVTLQSALVSSRLSPFAFLISILRGPEAGNRANAETSSSSDNNNDDDDDDDSNSSSRRGHSLFSGPPPIAPSSDVVTH
ncbi:hypothetical protein SPI_08489 [Niveomyces insectorum RCEF 264]|uniref:Uncharacterized protein n=1 Tax=Niveomyces insectorum RCEF 264 TaxID=1081102 RepID=A0A162IC28_9HYPO|nr:hypothetical protein SPI_08489 [Niveomyces insectorum RCEF 264]